MFSDAKGAGVGAISVAALTAAALGCGWEAKHHTTLSYVRESRAILRVDVGAYGLWMNFYISPTYQSPCTRSMSFQLAEAMLTELVWRIHSGCSYEGAVV